MNRHEARPGALALELPLALGLLAAAGLLLLWATQLALPLQAALWGGWVLLLALSVQQGWLHLCGPVLFYDLVRSGRRGRHVWLRMLYALLLLFVLFIIWSDTWYGRTNDHHRLVRMAMRYFEAFMTIQFVAVLLLTPAYVAGAIAEEKERKTLGFLLATDLRKREIILSKLLARLLSMGLLFLTGLPILTLLQFLGGIDPNLILAGFAYTSLLALSLAGVSILVSVQARRMRDAIALTYLAIVVYYVLSVGVLLLQGYDPYGIMGLPLWPGATLRDAVDVFNTGNLFHVLYELDTAGRRGGLQQLIPALLLRSILLSGLVFTGAVLWATARLRAVALRQMNAVAAAPGKRRWLGGQRKLAVASQRPMLWKEWYAEGSIRWGWIGRVFVALLVLASFVPLLFIAYHWYASQVYWDTTTRLEHLQRELNVWGRICTAILGTLTLLVVGVRAANSISGERERETWDSLLTAPLEAREILYAKWLGALGCVRGAWWWLGAIWLVGVCSGGLFPLAVPLLVAAWLVYAGFIAMLGLWYSLVSRTSLRATVYTLLTAGALVGGPWLLLGCCATVTRSSGRDMELLSQMLLGMTPPAALSFLHFALLDFQRHYDDHLVAKVVACSVIGMVLWSVITALLSNATLLRLAELTLRGGDLRPEYIVLRQPVADDDAGAEPPEQATPP